MRNKRNGILSDDQRDQIYKLMETGNINDSEIADIFKISEKTLVMMRLVINYAKAQDTESLKKYLSANRPLVNWACKKFKVPIASDNKSENQDKLDFNKDYFERTAKIEISLNETKTSIDKLCSSIQNLIDSINSNSDVIMGELKRQSDILNGIKMNTKKKGGYPQN